MKRKFAFTIAELMIFLIIIGILISIVFTTVKPLKFVTDKNIKYRYAAAYDALNLALFDIVNKEELNPFGPSEPNELLKVKKLCRSLTEYINTDSENCSTLPLSYNVTFMRNEEFDFRTINPHFTALNGMKFYISPLIKDPIFPATSRSYFNPMNPDFRMEFFMIYVDLNGTDNPKKAHTIKHDPNGKTNPDVFAFAILPTGDAIPIGLAEYNIKYLQTRVSYRENQYIQFSPYYSLNQAKHAAWDLYKPDNKNLVFKEKMSYTYNDYVKEILIRNKTQLYKFNESGEFPETFDSEQFEKCRPPAGTALTSYDICNITVETPNFGATH